MYVHGYTSNTTAKSTLRSHYEQTVTFQGLTLVHVRAQLEQLQETSRVELGYTVDRRAQAEL